MRQDFFRSHWNRSLIPVQKKIRFSSLGSGCGDWLHAAACRGRPDAPLDPPARAAASVSWPRSSRDRPRLGVSGWGHRPTGRYSCPGVGHVRCPRSARAQRCSGSVTARRPATIITASCTTRMHNMHNTTEHDTIISTEQKTLQIIISGTV